MTGEVVQLPGGVTTYRVGIKFGDSGISAAVDLKQYPSPDFIAEVQQRLEALMPVLINGDTVLLQFGPEPNLHPPRGSGA